MRMSGIKLVHVEGNSFRVENQKRDIGFKYVVGARNISLLASVGPENHLSQGCLFVQGSNTEYDDNVLCFAEDELKYALAAILKYNESIGVSSEWADNPLFKFPCKQCGEHFYVSEFNSIHFEYCESCIGKIKICDECGAFDAEYTFGSNKYCSRCVHTGAYCQVCETGDKVVKDRQIHLEGDYHGSSKYVNCCSNCWDKPMKLSIEHHYHYVPEQFNFWDIKKGKRIKEKCAPDKKLYMGVEVEAMFNQRSHTNIVLERIMGVYGEKKEDILYAKHDGTIPEPGVEIVTHPMTLAMMRSLTWRGLFDNVIRPSTHSVGGHIHINKNAFHSPLHIYKFTKFLRTNVGYVEFIGERPLQGDWCKSYSNSGKIVSIVKKYKNHSNSDRYEMINFTPQTVELRFFWSPPTASSFMKNAEFVDCLYNYTTTSKMHFTVEEFIKHVETNARYYPYLYNHHMSRGSLSFKSNTEYYDLNKSNSVFDDDDEYLGDCLECGISLYEYTAYVHVGIGFACSSHAYLCPMCDEYALISDKYSILYDGCVRNVCESCFDSGHVLECSCGSYYYEDDVCCEVPEEEEVN